MKRGRKPKTESFDEPELLTEELEPEVEGAKSSITLVPIKPRKLPKRWMITAFLDEDIYKAFHERVKKSKYSKQEVVVWGVKMFLENYNKMSAEPQIRKAKKPVL